MTIEEAIIAAIGVPGFQEASVQWALVNEGLNGQAEYNVTLKDVVNRAALSVLKGMLGVAEISEGDFTIKYAINARIGYLEEELGTTRQPKIRNVSFMH